MGSGVARTGFVHDAVDIVFLKRQGETQTCETSANDGDGRVGSWLNWRPKR